MSTTVSTTGPQEIKGVSVIAGRDAERPTLGRFRPVDPGSGTEIATEFWAATPEQVERACSEAWQAFYAMQARPNADRAALLEQCAANIAALGDLLIGVAASETGLSPARLVSERERTCNTLRLFAEVVREGGWVRAAIDHGDAARRPLPKPDVRRMLRPLGPVAVFGASNFPLAYSTAGGDTASALAAGCPVIVKGHSSHPGTGELVARAVTSAAAECAFHPGTFSFLHAGAERDREVGLELVRNRHVRAVGFTGSVAGGTALAREGASRADPIPVFAEMGSVNPVFLLANALEKEGKSIAERLYASITNASGQMCTCPGLIFAPLCDGLEVFLRTLADSMNQAGPMTMLSRHVRSQFCARLAEVQSVPGVEIRAGSPQAGHREGEGHENEQGFPIRCSPTVFRTSFDTFRRNRTLHEECFGPSAIVVVCESDDQMAGAAAMIQGSLTGSIFAGALDAASARQLQSILEQRVGRVVFNGVPTGVEVCASMVHGGPFPACNMPASTAVGHLAVERWCRPVCFQNVPEAMLRSELRDENPLGIRRFVDGKPEA